MRYRSLAGLITQACLVVTILCVASCAPTQQEDLARARVQRIIIIVQENRSFDNLFHGLAGADTASSGLTHDGARITLQSVPLAAHYDLDNSAADFVRSFDGGKMDGYDLRGALPFRGDGIPLRLAQYPAYAYVSPSDVRPYFDLARRYAVADRMFQSNIDQSFAAHLYLIAGQAGRAVDIPDGRPWGCDARWQTLVPLLSPQRRLLGAVYPCFDFTTLADRLDDKRLTWRYYAPSIASAKRWQHVSRDGEEHLSDPGRPDFGGNWSSFDAVEHVRFSSLWTHVVSPPSQILADVRHGSLANVTWVIPDWKNSDHSLSESDTGPSWVTSVINAIGESPFWYSSVIFVTWDDSGGWYDHVPPLQLDYDGLGARVPLIVVSPYAKVGYVSHQRYEFGSILKFAENIFGLTPLADSDTRANNPIDCFDFHRQPRAFQKIVARYPSQYFANQRPSLIAPDRN